jgi:SWI/SNF-related matrix-associated actin-dependent regulator 1 of chromatin subfamily A
MPAIHPSAYTVKMTFGKFKGRSLGEICNSNRGYLEWMAGADGIPEVWRVRCAKVLLGEEITGDSNTKVEVRTVKAIFKPLPKQKVAVTFEYDDAVIARFRDVIDGKKWNKEGRYWEVPAAQLPKLVEFFGKANVTADDKIKQWYRDEVERRTTLDEIRAKDDSDIKIATKLDLFPYQKVAVEFIERAGGRAMDADQMGLGKTATAIGYAVYKNAKTLVICPKSVKLNWVREIERFAGKKTCLWESTGREGRINAQFHVINYDIVQKHIRELQKLDFDLLVCDEATYLKNHKSIRSKSILGYYKERKKFPGIKTKWAILLTGTPILNRPMEAFTLLSFLDKNRFSNAWHFKNRYGGDPGFPPQNLDELHERTKDLVIRRLKSQVANELPPKQRFDLLVEMDKAEVKAYNKHIDKLFQKWRLNGHPSAAHMPEIRNYLFELKFPRVTEFVDEMLASDRPVLVFTIHQEHAYRIGAHYGDKARVLTGNETGKARQVIIDDLANGRAQVGVFTVGAGGMGIDGLQHTMDAVLFVDQAWTPALHDQAEDRLHRKGQIGQVQVWYLVVKDTFDEHMRQILSAKQSIIDQAVEGEELPFGRNASVFKEVVQMMIRYRKEEEFEEFDEEEGSDFVE